MIDALLDELKKEAARARVNLVDDFLEKGLELLEERIHGEASDEQVIEWVREAQRRDQ